MNDVIIARDWWEDDSDGAISAWFVENGDKVDAGAVIAEVMNEKVSFELTAPAAGTITILVPAEDPVQRGQIVARIEG